MEKGKQNRLFGGQKRGKVRIATSELSSRIHERAMELERVGGEIADVRQNVAGAMAGDYERLLDELSKLTGQRDAMAAGLREMGAQYKAMVETELQGELAGWKEQRQASYARMKEIQGREDELKKQYDQLSWAAKDGTHAKRMGYASVYDGQRAFARVQCDYLIAKADRAELEHEIGKVESALRSAAGIKENGVKAVRGRIRQALERVF